MTSKINLLNVPETIEQGVRGRRRREANPTVQMSVRAREDVYDRFRMHCEQERRTNGDMLEVMMACWEKHCKSGKAD